MPEARAALHPTASRRGAWLAAAAIVALYLGLLAHFPLAEPDEGRYAEIAREMILGHDWVTPHLNFVKYFEKPPLVYWFTAVCFQCLGVSEFVARLCPALSGLLGIGIAAMLGSAMYDAWTGLVAAAVLAATPIYFGLSQFLVLDMPLSGLLAVALASFWFAYAAAPGVDTVPRAARRRRSAYVALLAASTALAVLTKGPVAVVLTGGTILLFLIAQRRLTALRWVLTPVPLLVFLLIALPWFVLVARRNPEFVDFFVFKQHVSRFLTPDEHRQPFWFFVPIVLGGMLPWTGFVLLAPHRTLHLAARLVRWRLSPAAQYCLIWSATVFLFFSASGSKLGTYILPMFCPLAILAARWLRSLVTTAAALVFERAAVATFVFAVLALIGATVTPAITDNWVVAEILPYVYAGGVALGCAGFAAWRLARRGALQCSLAALGGGILALQAIAISARGVIPQYRPLGLALRRMVGAGDQLLMYRHYTQGIPFYSRHRAVMVGGRGELDFGSRQGDQSAFFWNTDAQLVQAWHGPRHVFLVINRSELEPLRPQLQPPPRQVASCDKKVIVVNFPPS